jgi:DNA-binding PadR family transcriptional regulator
MPASFHPARPMKSFQQIGNVPSARPFTADEVIELHAARLLLLLKMCGVTKRGRIDGLTKLAKLDYFVRYPQAFNRVTDHLLKNVTSATDIVESSMIRHHYGPWDKRYYQILPFLEARRLITVTKRDHTYCFELTDQGLQVARELGQRCQFNEQIEQMKRVKSVLGKKTGTGLKNLIYELFENEVANKPLGEVIQ